MKSTPVILKTPIVSLKGAVRICWRVTPVLTAFAPMFTRPAGISPEERRKQMAENAKPTTAWTPWLWCWVGSEDVASAHRLIMEKADTLPPHDVYFLNADDTSALEPSQALVERFKPEFFYRR